MNLLNLKLLDNSVDSLNEGLTFYIRGDEEQQPRLFKFSILLFAHSLELLLKEVLRREHYSLIYSNIDENKKRVNDLHTVNIETSIQRINRFTQNKLPYNVSTYISDIQNHRNKIQHYEIELSLEASRATISKAFYAIKYIGIDLLGMPLNNFIDDEIIDRLEEIESIQQDTLKIALENMKAQDLVRTKFEVITDEKMSIPCPLCGQNTLADLHNDIHQHQKCFYCLAEFNDLEECLENDEHSFISEYLNKKVKFFRHKCKMDTCPYCNSESLIFHDRNDSWFCIDCLESFSAEHCQNCSEPMTKPQYIGAFFNKDLEWEYESICKKCSESDSYIEVLDQ